MLSQLERIHLLLLLGFFCYPIWRQHGVVWGGHIGDGVAPNENHLPFSAICPEYFVVAQRPIRMLVPDIQTIDGPQEQSQ